MRFDETPDGWDVTLEVGWGDCYSGCIHRRTWVYALSRDLREVELLDEYGAELSSGQREACATRWTGS